VDGLGGGRWEHHCSDAVERRCATTATDQNAEKKGSNGWMMERESKAKLADE
jgi:hypothetical protein